MRKSNLTKFFLAFSVLSVLPFLAQAVEYGGIGGRPAYPVAGNPRTESIFIHTLNLGDVQKEGVLIVNNSGETKTILVYGVDSTPSTGGAFACKQFSEPKTDVGAWISLSESEVTLAPAANKLVPFMITVPNSASVGEHNGCIILQEKKAAVENQGGASLSFRTGLRVAITVPGDLSRKLEIAGFDLTKKDNGNFLLQPKVKNLGNVSIDADAKVTTRYFFGLTYMNDGGQYPILRGDTSDWNFELSKPFWGGWYRSNFTVAYDANPEATVGVQSGKTLTTLSGPAIWFFSSPAPLALAIEIIILLLLISFVSMLLLSQKRKNWIQKNWVMYEVKSGDDINSLSREFDVSWKLIAKTNRLEAPYALHAGEKIKVPPGK